MKEDEFRRLLWREAGEVYSHLSNREKNSLWKTAFADNKIVSQDDSTELVAILASITLILVERNEH